MNYLSVCSGIEAATVAWHQMGWKPVGFSEIEKFPSEVLAHHYPNVPNLGDMTKFKEWDFGTNRLDLLVGGTPCQSFSVAGLRKGLDDPRGNLALTYAAILDKFRPKWCIWENVPGVLSSNKGRDFGAFLGAMVELGYGWAYRVLDAQNFGVAQRRRRVFVVGCLGGWESAAKVLFESESLSGNIKQGKKKRESVAGYVESSFGQYREDVIAGTTKASGGVLGGGSETFLTVYENHPSDSRVKEMGETCQTVTSTWGMGGGNIPFVQSVVGFNTNARPDEMKFLNEHSNTLTASQNSGIAVDMYNLTTNNNTSQTIRNGTDIDHVGGIMQTIGSSEISGTLRANPGSGWRSNGTPVEAVAIQNMAVRRLTEVECERLQGFPDNYTNIKENCPSGARYKALGNSMAVPVMRWIGERINKYERGEL